ncbi:MAG: redoxin domain-containing protein [Methylococcaceae bacterium]|nr:redoxin domain-containing protein [Prolixibacteraceae bacterium]
MKRVVLIGFLFILFMGFVTAQVISIPMVGSKAPSFTANSTNGMITFPESFGKSWKILFSHPKDFTPVCSSELLELAYNQNDFNDLGVKIAVVSIDNLEINQMWKANLEAVNYKERGPQKINFPIIDDQTITASRKYGMIQIQSNTKSCVRGMFIIDPDNIIRGFTFYPMNVGRNMDEIKRTIIALQTSDQMKVYTPADWEPGKDVLMRQYPYTQKELAQNPSLKNKYYTLNGQIWFMKVENMR